MSSATRARVALTFDDGGTIDSFTDATLHDSFVDPLGSLTITAAPLRNQYRDYRKKLSKGEQVHLYINKTHQGRFLVEDVDAETSAGAGGVIKVTCHTPLLTPYQGAVDPDLSLTSLSDVSIENALLTLFAPYGFTKIVTDARAHVNALTGVPLPGGKPPPFAVGDLKMKNAVAHDGETAYQFAARIVTRLGCCIKIAEDDTLLVVAPDYDQDLAYTVVCAVTPGTYPGADRFFGAPKVRETNAGQFAQTEVIGMRHLAAGDSNVARPRALVKAEDVIPARCRYRSSAAPFKPFTYKDKSSRDANQAQNAALFELGMRAKDAYVVTGDVDGWISRTGRIWTAGTMGRVVVELEDLDDPMFLLERTLHLDAGQGQRASLAWIPKGALILGEKPTKGH
jgi:hypothetical protein